MKNERNAGRKKMFNVPAQRILVPEPLIEEVEKLSKPYLNEKKLPPTDKPSRLGYLTKKGK